MVRNYVKKTNRKPTTPRKLQAAVSLVKAGWSIRQAAKNKDVCRERLRRTVESLKTVSDTRKETDVLQLSYQTRIVFPKVLEDQIADYCIQVAQTGYGLSVLGCRELAYEVADKNREKLKVPSNWHREKLAGIDWFHGFQKRHPNISLRVAEACSVARAMAFNKHTVKFFFDKYSEVRERHASFKDGSRLYNLDETNTSTVQNMKKILSPKGIRQVHQVKGTERGESVTTCMIIGAHGTVLPPVHIFPRKKLNPDFMINAYPGSLGLANAKGYMTKEAFVKVIEHFIRCTSSSKENPSLLLLDNVDTHFSIATLDLAKENGVVIFTFPPHCTHRLQPLDVGFFGPFKAHYDRAVCSYLRDNPGTPPTIYRVAGFVKEALCKVASPQTIIKSFEAPGIVPFNRNVFTEADFQMATVTETPDPTVHAEAQNSQDQSVVDLNNSSDALEDCNKSTSKSPAVEHEKGPNCDLEPNTSTEQAEPFIGPMAMKGLPKAKASDGKRKPRRKGKCMIATDTPEKEEICRREVEATQKKQKTEERKRKKEGEAKERPSRKISTKEKTKRSLNFESDGSEEADDVGFDHVEKGCIDAVNKPCPQSLQPLLTKPKEGDYVMVHFQNSKESAVYYIGKILKEEDEEGDLEISYYRKKLIKDKTVCFTLPLIPDLNSVNIKDIKVILSKPKAAAVTRRQQNIVTFDFDFSNFKLR